MSELFKKSIDFDDPFRKRKIITILCLICTIIVSVFFYGARVIFLALTSVAVTLLCHLISEKAQPKSGFSSLTAIIEGLMFVCLLSPASGYLTVIVGAIFGQLIVKLPFGGNRNCHINSVAAAFCFCAISWSGNMFGFPDIFSDLALFKSISAETLGHSPAYSLMMGGLPSHTVWEMLLGAVPGNIGAAPILLILASLLVFVQRKEKGIYMTFSTLASFAVFSLIFNRTVGNAFLATLYELLSDVILFGAVFMIPMSERFMENRTAGVLFSVSAGFCSVIFHYFGGIEGSFCFALLLCSLMTPIFNKYSSNVYSVIKRFFGRRSIKKGAKQ